MRSRPDLTKSLAYLRTSSAANLDGDSSDRQRDAIQHFAQRAGYEICGEYYDEAVSGADPIETRPGFAEMLDRIESNGVRTIIVEDSSRFARSVVAQELGVLLLQKRGVTVLASNGDNLTETDDPSKVAMRQMASVFSQFEKTRLVAKLKGARDRKRKATGRCEGRTPVPVAIVKKARRLVKNPRTGEPRSLREIAALLAKDETIKKTYAPESIRKMLGASGDRVLEEAKKRRAV